MEKHENLHWLAEQITTVILNERTLHSGAEHAWTNNQDISYDHIIDPAARAAGVRHELQIEIDFTDFRWVLKQIKESIYHHFNDVHQLQEKQTMSQLKNTYETVVRKRNDLVFGHDLTLRNKEELMSIIRDAKAHADSFEDLVDTSSYAAKTVAGIKHGIKLCVQELDK